MSALQNVLREVCLEHFLSTATNIPGIYNLLGVSLARDGEQIGTC